MGTNTGSVSSSTPLLHFDYPLRARPGEGALRALSADDVCVPTGGDGIPLWACGPPSFARTGGHVAGTSARELAGSSEAERLWCVSESLQSRGGSLLCTTLDGVRGLNATQRAIFASRARDTDVAGPNVKLVSESELACQDACKNTRVGGQSCEAFMYRAEGGNCHLYSDGKATRDGVPAGWIAHDAGWTLMSTRPQNGELSSQNGDPPAAVPAQAGAASSA